MCLFSPFVVFENFNAFSNFNFGYFVNLIFQTVRFCRTVTRFSLLRKSLFVDLGRIRHSSGDFGQDQRKAISICFGLYVKPITFKLILFCECWLVLKISTPYRCIPQATDSNVPSNPHTPIKNIPMHSTGYRQQCPKPPTHTPIKNIPTHSTSNRPYGNRIESLLEGMRIKKVEAWAAKKGGWQCGEDHYISH